MRHDHDHDCQHDHDHDGEGQEATVEEVGMHLVTSFCNIAFLQVDFEKIDQDDAAQQKLLLFVFGMVHAFADADSLEPEQIRDITCRVLSALFPWDDETVDEVFERLIESSQSASDRATMVEGQAAMEAALEAGSRLVDVLER